MSDEERPNLATLFTLEKIVRAIKQEGAQISATRLRNYLGISVDLFEAAANYGCKFGYISRGDWNIYTYLKAYIISEEAYYPLVGDQINALWRRDKYDDSQFYLENTSRRDSKIIGPWTRPDFTLVSHKKFPWTIGHEFDVVTFEVKRPDSANVLAVFEALAHATAATRAYVIFPIGDADWNKDNDAQARRVRDECGRHGVGLILIEDLLNDPKVVHVLKAVRREIDHEKCSSFLEAVLSPDGKNKIAQWK